MDSINFCPRNTLQSFKAKVVRAVKNWNSDSACLDILYGTITLERKWPISFSYYRQPKWQTTASFKNSAISSSLCLLLFSLLLGLEYILYGKLYFFSMELHMLRQPSSLWKPVALLGCSSLSFYQAWPQMAPGFMEDCSRTEYEVPVGGLLPVCSFFFSVIFFP